jgi:hypothetical protein
VWSNQATISKAIGHRLLTESFDLEEKTGMMPLHRSACSSETVVKEARDIAIVSSGPSAAKGGRRSKAATKTH